MEQSPPWEAESHSVDQDTRISWSTEWNPTVHKSPPLDLSQQNPGRILLTVCLRSILILPFHLQVTIRDMLRFLWYRVITQSPTSQAGEQPLVSSSQLLIQYIRSNPSYLKAVSSNRNLGKHNAVMTGDSFNMETWHDYENNETRYRLRE
jgi:hypothetical protein